MSAGSLQNMLNALPIPSLAIDGTERIVAANSLCQTLLGTSPIDRRYWMRLKPACEIMPRAKRSIFPARSVRI